MTYNKMQEEERWTIEHFSQSNGSGEDSDNVPDLLRLVADSIEELGRVEVQDVVFHNEITDAKDHYSMTVYFYRVDDQDG